jgi:1-deoxy-D-xylulose-5-phosphate synthase
MGLLESINQPSDLRGLSKSQLSELAEEIRACLITTVSRTGGHLAASLGAVELAVAIHHVLDSPNDKVIWDVGHQAYAHKLLTGRRERFETLRQAGGLSGFPRREESEHDAFDTGHGSTAIAAGLGMAKARDLAKQDYAVVAVVGDGAMSGGMSFEGLNYAGHLKTPLLVILNDNEMSISRNVGALAGYLSSLRLEPHYQKVKADLESFAARFPLGTGLIEAMQRLKQGVKHLLLPGMLFEQLGFTYLGPVDGHDLPALIDALKQARELKGPVLLHAITQKGRGYVPAENNAEKWHRTGSFDIETGEPLSHADGVTYTRVFGDTLVELAEGNPSIVAITAAMKEGTGLETFAERFPARFFDVGMAEQTAVTFAAGLAAQGFRPVAAIYSTFLQRSYDQIVHDVALPHLPVVLAVDRGGLVGGDGPTHHGVFDLSYLRHIPGLVVMAPKDLTELAAMLHTALEIEGPCALRYPRGVGENPPAGPVEALPVGKAEVVREGQRVALFAVGSMVGHARQAAELLAEQGLSPWVVNARFVKPLDAELLCDIARGCEYVMTVEENAISGGFGSAVLELLAHHRVTVPTLTLGIPDEFVEHGSPELLYRLVGLDPESIARRVTAFVTAGAGSLAR